MSCQSPLITIKLQVNDDLRRIKVSSLISFLEFQSLAKQLFKDVPIQNWDRAIFKYRDNENDVCSISTQEEFLESFEARKGDILKVDISFQNHVEVAAIENRSNSNFASSQVSRRCNQPKSFPLRREIRKQMRGNELHQSRGLNESNHIFSEETAWRPREKQINETQNDSNNVEETQEKQITNMEERNEYKNIEEKPIMEKSESYSPKPMVSFDAVEWLRNNKSEILKPLSTQEPTTNNFPEEQKSIALASLLQMGFLDLSENLKALEQSNGDLTAAVEILLSRRFKIEVNNQ